MSRQVKELPALETPQKKNFTANLVARFQAFRHWVKRLRKIYSALGAYFTQIIYEAFCVSRK